MLNRTIFFSYSLVLFNLQLMECGPDPGQLQSTWATAPGREQLLNWITEAWDFLSHDTIVSGFEKANMISARIPANYVEQSAESVSTDSLCAALPETET